MSKIGLIGTIAGWSAFAGSHLYMSDIKNRAHLVKYFGGEDKFQTVYSLLSFGTLAPTIYFYRVGLKNSPTFYNPIRNSAVGKVFAGSLFVLSGACIGLAFGNRSPLARGGTPKVKEEKAGGEERENLSSMGKDKKGVERKVEVRAKGIQRITRHAAFGSFALLGVSRLLVANTLPGVLFWMGFPVFWYFGSLHQDERKKLDPSLKLFYSETSLLPFLAIYERRNKLALDEMAWTYGAVGAAAFTGLLAAFPTLILKLK